MQLKRPDRAGADLSEIADLLAAHTGITCTPSEDRALLAGRFERLHPNIHVLGLRFVVRLMSK
jgi:hypothetical protein